MEAKLSPKQLENFHSRLLGWFRAHKRDLPWRRSRNPYRIWIAEVMLQQTRIAAVLPYYHRFLKKFPTVQSLANGNPEALVRPGLLQPRVQSASRRPGNRLAA
jgi:A/G-specific adenine glycosylase